LKIMLALDEPILTCKTSRALNPCPPSFRIACGTALLHMRTKSFTAGASASRQHGWYDPIGARTIGQDQWPYISNISATDTGTSSSHLMQVAIILLQLRSFLLPSLPYSSALRSTSHRRLVNRSVFRCAAFWYHDGVISE
jgi:hypothetical protein